jgi:hypothetical protein
MKNGSKYKKKMLQILLSVISIPSVIPQRFLFFLFCEVNLANVLLMIGVCLQVTNTWIHICYLHYTSVPCEMFFH